MIDMKNKNMGGIFPWPKAISRPLHRAMSRGVGNSESQVIQIGVVGANDGSELHLINYDQTNSVQRVNATGATVWAQNVTSVRAGSTGGNYILCCFYDSVDACVYVLTLATSGTDLLLDRINIASGAVTHIGGAVSAPGFISAGIGTHMMCRKVPGIGNLIVTRNDGSLGMKILEINPATGALAVPPTVMTAANAVVSDVRGISHGIGYFSADGNYHLAFIYPGPGTANYIGAGKNGFMTFIRAPAEGFGMLGGSYGSNWASEIVVVDVNTVAVCNSESGTRYFNRVEFDKWLKTIVDAQGI